MKPSHRALQALGAVATCCLIATSVQAAPVNIDFAIAGFGATPPSTFGAASGQAGVWNSVTSTAGAASLMGLSGAVLAGVSLAISGSNGFTSLGVSGAPPDVAALIQDGIRRDDPVMTFAFSGLDAGAYDVYTYALDIDSSDYGGTIAVVGSGDAAQSIFGAWGGSFVLGTNYALHSVAVGGAGTLTMNITALAGANSARVAGVQLVQRQQVPEPGSLALAALALLALAGITTLRLRGD